MTRRRVRRLLRLAPFFVLAAENLLVFWRHYFEGAGFPWDFIGSYYAAAAYWTEAVVRGSLPMWMPFQSMGYPFLLNLQTGVFYPPMWIFPLLKIPYTLPAAVVFQCLHVLAGAFGTYVLARSFLRSRREALLAAFAFQLFGGFYSNAQHVDIIRAFALTPWLLWSCLPPRGSEGERLPRRTLLAPLFVFAMAVGGYPGNLLAALFLLAVLLLFVLIQRRFALSAIRWAGAVAASMVLGLGMAAIHLGPAWIYRGEQLRYHVAYRLFRASLGVVHLPGLVLENRDLPIDKSMTSTWVGFAVIAGLLFAAWPTWKRFWPYVALAALAAAMAAGNNLPVNPLVRSLLPPLGFSRFPASDYRGFFAVLLILIAAAGWRDLRRRRPGAVEFVLRFLPLVAFTVWSLRRIHGPRAYWPEHGLAEAGLVATFAALAVWKMRGWPRAGVLAMLAAIAIDGARVLPRIAGWNEADILGICREFAPTPARMYDAGLVVAPNLFERREGPRPPRGDGDGPYRGSGYLQGDFLTGDFGTSVLRARETIWRNPAWFGLMCREWLPIVVDPPPAAVTGTVDVLDLAVRARDAAPDPRVFQESLGIDDARYRVDTQRPVLLVENEVFFPGWSSEQAGDAVRVNGLFRGWLLPAGTYTLETRFRVDGLRLLAGVTAAAWLLWLLWVLAIARSRRRGEA